ncbi:MAG: PaaI family thioesterase [Actinomycetota bacterium]
MALGDQLFYETPVHAFMGFRLVQREPIAIVTMEQSENVRGAMPNTVHGGILATMADVTCALALTGTFEEGVEVPVTTDMHVRYLRQPTTYPVTAEARAIHRGRRLLSVECTITDGADRQLVRTTATYMLVPFTAG